MTMLSEKSSVEEIRQRFDSEVERFSCLETGQQATIDAPLVLELVAQAASTHLTPQARVLDIGCGAGNFTLRVMQEAGRFDAHLVDLSGRMLERAAARVRTMAGGEARTYQHDFRELTFEESSFDCILAGAVLHHLRDDADWESGFRLLHRWLRPGGRLYVADLAYFDDPGVHSLMWKRFGQHLTGLGGEDCREKVFAYIEKEDSPRSLAFQFELLRRTGFSSWDVLHRNSVFACYYAQK